MPQDRPTASAKRDAQGLRSRLGRCALAAWLVFVQSLPLASGETPTRVAAEQSLSAKLAKRGDLNLQSTSLPHALLTIGELWQINLVIGDDVQGQVSGVFQNAPLQEILNSILLSNGYSYRPVGQSLVVMKMDALGDVNPLFETATLPLRGGDPKDIIEAARLISSPKGKIQAVPSARSLLVVDYPERVAMLRSFLQGLDNGVDNANVPPPVDDPAELRMASFRPQFVPAASCKESLTAGLSKEGKLAVLEMENRIVVIDYPNHLKLCEQMLKKIDIRRQQVRITSYIYDISLEDMQALGINWNHALKGRPGPTGLPQNLWALDTITAVPLDAGVSGGLMTAATLSRNFDLRAMIVALSNAKDSRLLADPNVTVVDNEPAMISIVSEIPYQQLTQTGQGGQIGTTAFREAGVKLAVTPHISDDGTILMKVEPEFSRLTGYTPEQNQPIIDRRTAQTQVRVNNGHTLVLGGLRQKTDITELSGIPILMDIKYIGWLFRTRRTNCRESELVVFIKPELVTTDEPLREREAVALGYEHERLDGIPSPYGPSPVNRKPGHHHQMKKQMRKMLCLPPTEEGDNQQNPANQQEEVPAIEVPPSQDSAAANLRGKPPTANFAARGPLADPRGQLAAPATGFQRLPMVDDTLNVQAQAIVPEEPPPRRNISTSTRWTNNLFR